MQKKVIISKATKQVVESIKLSIAAKKEKHQQLMKSIDPSLAANLQKMKKVDFSRK